MEDRETEERLKKIANDNEEVVERGIFAICIS